MIKTYESKTGYVRRIADKVCYKAKTIYLGKFDAASNYEDISEAVYNKYLKAEEEKRKAQLSKL